MTTKLYFPEIDTSRDFYRREETAAFMDPAGEFGELSNRAPGYPIRVNGIDFLTTEALFQALKYPADENFQRLLAAQHDPNEAKEMGNSNSRVRRDWDEIKVQAMRYTVAAKLRAHPKFAQVLTSTGDLDIVEMSFRDTFWGAQPDPDYLIMVGRNTMGKILTLLREELGWTNHSPHQTAQNFMDDLPRSRLAIGSRVATPRPTAPKRHDNQP